MPDLLLTGNDAAAVAAAAAAGATMTVHLHGCLVDMRRQVDAGVHLEEVGGPVTRHGNFG